MASKAERTAVNLAGLVQGIVLVTFPAASTILTSKGQYGLSSTQYGIMFLPQVVTAIVASLLGSALARRITTKRVYLIGLTFSAASMGLLLGSTPGENRPTGRLSAAPGRDRVPGGRIRPDRPGAEYVYLGLPPGRRGQGGARPNALLGLGTVLAPVLVAVFVGLGFWWGLPIVSAVLLVALLLVSVRLPLHAGAAPRRGARRAAGLPARFWVYAAFAVLYGICETINGNWSQLDMTSHLGASAAQASVALAVFWAMVTVGRVLFAAIGRWLPERVTYRALPLVLVAAFVLLGLLPRHDAVAGIALFGLAGLGCSALLPLTISFGVKDLTAISAAMAGGVIAFYQLGYGIAAFGVGPLQKAGVSLPAIFGGDGSRGRSAGDPLLRRRSLGRFQPSPRSGRTGHRRCLTSPPEDLHRAPLLKAERREAR